VGGGAAYPIHPPLEPGDEVTITVERLGSLTNRVVAGSPTPEVTAFRPPPAR
jgi:2-keto-4-pentenoate hydratase/2-oxohepta-3-ene-1,7-dioic acid hydratase in catechol pathway